MPELQRAAPYSKSPMGEMGPLWPALHVRSTPISGVIGMELKSNTYNTEQNLNCNNITQSGLEKYSKIDTINKTKLGYNSDKQTNILHNLFK